MNTEERCTEDLVPACVYVTRLVAFSRSYKVIEVVCYSGIGVVALYSARVAYQRF